MVVSFLQASGQADDHIDANSLEQPVHRDMVSPLLALKAKAGKQGFDLRVASGYRSFQRQLAIWNAKASGDRALLDANGEVLSCEHLNSQQLLHTILRWSAMPGGSRHHWGCDIDVFDAAVVPEGYSIQLTVEEARGMFAELHQWLDEVLPESGFYRPYCGSAGGVAQEPWHLSYRPLSQYFQQSLRPELLKQLLAGQEILLKPVILECFDELYARYIADYFTVGE